MFMLPFYFACFSVLESRYDTIPARDLQQYVVHRLSEILSPVVYLYCRHEKTRQFSLMAAVAFTS